MDTKNIQRVDCPESFKNQDICDTYSDILLELYGEEEHFKLKAEYLQREYWGAPDDLNWFYQMKIEQNEKAMRKIQKLIIKIKTKIKILTGEFDESNFIDLEAIKQIPCEQFLGNFSYRSDKTIHYKAPWRDEKSASLVVYTRQNRFHDFGDPDKSGSVIDLIMHLEKMDFKQAINYLKGYVK